MPDAEKSNARNRAQEKWYKENGICVKCRVNDAQPHKTMCAECLEKMAKKQRERIIRMTETQRDSLRKVNREYKKAKRQEFIKAGMCSECGKHKAVEGYKLCLDCRTKNLNRMASRRKTYRLMAGLCRYCDEPALNGRTTCLKHRKIFADAAKKMRESAAYKRGQEKNRNKINAMWREIKWEKQSRNQQKRGT